MIKVGDIVQYKCYSGGRIRNAIVESIVFGRSGRKRSERLNIKFESLGRIYTSDIQPKRVKLVTDKSLIHQIKLKLNKNEFVYDLPEI